MFEDCTPERAQDFKQYLEELVRYHNVQSPNNAMQISVAVAETNTEGIFDIRKLMGATFRKAADADRRDNAAKMEQHEARTAARNSAKTGETKTGLQEAPAAPKEEAPIPQPEETAAKPEAEAEPEKTDDSDDEQANADDADVTDSGSEEAEENKDEASEQKAVKHLKKKGKGFGRYYRK